MGGISVETVIRLLLGLAIFLYGMRVMSDNLEAVAGNKLKKAVGLLTSNPFIGVFVGIVVTALIQSSSATTVMVIGFVNAGIMSLYQAVGIIMGANIGTTITGQMISFDLGAIAPYAIIIGALGIALMNKSHKEHYFFIIFGFGLLFLGIDYMSGAMEPLKDSPAVARMIESLSKPGILNTIMAMGVGAGLTALIQSSSALTSIIVVMAGSGAIGIEASFPIILGANVGTTVTALLSSIGANKNAKKASLIHLLFNLIGALIFLTIFVVFRKETIGVMHSLGNNPERQVANCHSIFNVMNTVILFPFAKNLIRIVNKLVPGEDSNNIILRLDKRMIETPSFAIQMAKTEIDRMGEMAMESLEHSIVAYTEKNTSEADKVFNLEKKINLMEQGLFDFLLEINDPSLTKQQKSFIDNMYNIISDIERIGDRAENIAEMALEQTEEDIYTSDMAIKQINDMAEKVKKSVSQALKALSEEDRYLAQKVIAREDKIDEIEKSMRKEHIKRLQDGKCAPSSGVIFLDVVSNLERVSDHSAKIAYYILDIKE